MDKTETIDALIGVYFKDLVPVPTIFGVSRTLLLPPFFLFAGAASYSRMVYNTKSTRAHTQRELI